MHAAIQPTRSQGQPKREGPNPLGRAIRYLRRYPRMTTLAYLALFVATAAQLAVPELVQNIIDTIIDNSARKTILEQVPSNFQQLAAERFGLDFSTMQLDLDNAPRALLWAAVLIILFSVARGLFTFAQTYLSQALSQDIAFELRNDLFSKIQRLSFSYHDRNQTGQLMIRATDDVERLRLFIGQGLLMALQALVLLVATL
jgi:ATP-binding cassette subfamily B protein